MRISLSTIGLTGLRRSLGGIETMIPGAALIDVTASPSTVYKDAGVTLAAPGDNVWRVLERTEGGRYANQSSTSLQPVYGRGPVGGRRNLLLATGNFLDPVWTKDVGVSVSHSGEVGTLTFTAASQLFRQAATAYIPSAAFTPSVEIRSDTPQTIRLHALSSGGAINATKVCSVTTEWQPFSAPATAVATGGDNFRFRLQSDQAGTIQIRRPQLELGSVRTAYQNVVSAYDASEAGVATHGYLRFDVTDDKMAQVYPTSQTGDLMIFGRKGSWLAEGVTVAAGGTLNAINGKDGPLTQGIIPLLGDIVGWYHAPRTMTPAERATLTDHFKTKGAKGLITLGAELVTNGAFSSDTVWAKGAGVTISGGNAAFASVASGAGLTQNTAEGFTVGQPVLISFDVLAYTSGNGIFVRVGNVGSFASIGATSPKRYTQVVTAGGASNHAFFGEGAGNGTYSIDNVSVKKLVMP